MIKFILFVFFMIPLSFLDFYLVFLFLGLIIFIFLKIAPVSTILLGLGFGCDLFSGPLILLRFFICLLIFIARSKIYMDNNFHFYFSLNVIILLFFLICAFSSLNFILFYVFFESSLIPTLFLILGWGYQPERIQAGFYLLFYTLFASLPIFLGLIHYYLSFGSLSIFLIFQVNRIIFFNIIIFVFLVKIPIFVVHLWLPKAHVEAPVSGSIILAGVILKLGGYGLLRVFPLFKAEVSFFRTFFVRISVFGGLIVSLICLRQRDIKSLIAYSSVAHISIVISGCFTLTTWGVIGSLIIIISHGICSSGLFCLANITYERSLRRSLYLNKGYINILPNLSLWWFLLCSSNIAAPPSLNLVSEILILSSLVSWRRLIILILSFLSFLRAAYSLFLYSFTQHGMVSRGLFSFWSVNVREYLLLFCHWIPLNLIFLFIDNLFSLYSSILIKNFVLW